MQSAAVYRDTFHKQIRSFMKELMTVFPTDRDIKLFSSSLTITLMDDPENTVITKFYKSFHQCETYIDNQDDRLFYNSMIRSELDIMNKLSQFWEQLDVDNQRIVWDYLKVLYHLSKSFLLVQNK